MTYLDLAIDAAGYESNGQNAEDNEVLESAALPLDSEEQQAEPLEEPQDAQEVEASEAEEDEDAELEEDGDDESHD